MLKLVLDTNVYISAILFGGKPEEIRKLAAEGEIEIAISEAIISEIAEVLRRKFGMENWQISQIVDDVREVTSLVIPQWNIHVVEDDSDNRVLECAVEGNVRYIVSGDRRHLLPLKDYKGIEIVSPDEFLRFCR